MLLVYATFLATFSICIFALLKGDWEEKVGAGVVVGMLAVDLVGRIFLPPTFLTVSIVGLIPDLLGFLAFVSLSLHSRVIWPLWASSLQLLSLGAHLIRALHIKMGPMAYYLMKSLPTTLVLIVLLIGTVQAIRRRRANANASSSPS